MKFYFDFETHLIQPGCIAPPPVCMVYAHDNEAPSLVHVRDSRFAKTLHDALLSNATMVAHYATFETLVMMAYRPEWTKLIFEKLRKGQIQCTLVREKLIRIGRGDRKEGFGLDKCLEAWNIAIALDKKDYWRARYGMLIDKPIAEWPQEAISYVLGDIAVRDLYLAQETAGPQYLVDQGNQMRASISLGLTSAWGFATDPVAAAKLVKATEALVVQDEKVILEAGLARYTKKKGVMAVTKDKKAAEARLILAYQAMGKEPPRGDITENMEAKGIQDGNVKLNDEACNNSGDEVLKSYTRYGQAGTLLSKARRLLHSPIQCSYNVLVATGRTSCRQGDDPKPGEAWSTYGMQTQNLPRVAGVRECFVARPGHAIVSIDFDQFELRTWSQVCINKLGYSDMAVVLRDPTRCPHVEMGALVERVSAKEAYDFKKTDPKRFKQLRQLAKALNFGAPGGLGAARFGDFARGTYGVDVSEDRARELLNMWRNQWREAGKYLDMIGDLVGGRGSKVQLEHVGSKRLRGDVGYCDAANSYFQGLAADAAKGGLVELMYGMYEKGHNDLLYGVRQLAFVHDEVLLEIPLDRLHEAAYAARDAFVGGAQVWVPDVPLTAQPAASLCWTKASSDPTFDSNGRLICYEHQAQKAA